MAFPVSTWPCSGLLSTESICTEKVRVSWIIADFLREHLKKRKEFSCQSKVFSFAGASWTLFASFAEENKYSLFGINVRKTKSSDVLDCIFDISFQNYNYCKLQDLHHCLRCERAETHFVEERFFLDWALKSFLERGFQILCIISVKKRIIKEPSQTQLLEKEDKGSPMANCENKVLEDLKKLLLSGEGSDVIFQVQNQQFPAHRIIVTARSSVFAAMFRHDMKENATGVVNIEDCNPNSFSALLEFLYCGSTEKLSVENMFNLYKSADKYDVQDLKMKCLLFIKNNISANTFCEVFRHSLQHSDENLLKLVKEFFIKNCQQVISTPEWKTFISENPIQGNELFMEAAKFISPTPR